MLKRNLLLAWIGVAVLSGLFLMGQENWPPPERPFVLTQTLAEFEPESSARLDLDDDGALDILLAANPQIAHARNIGGGQFQPVTSWNVARAKGFGLHDVSLDGRLDPFVAQPPESEGSGTPLRESPEACAPASRNSQGAGRVSWGTREMRDPGEAARSSPRTTGSSRQAGMAGGGASRAGPPAAGAGPGTRRCGSRSPRTRSSRPSGAGWLRSSPPPRHGCCRASRAVPPAPRAECTRSGSCGTGTA